MINRNLRSNPCLAKNLLINLRLKCHYSYEENDARHAAQAGTMHFNRR